MTKVSTYDNDETVDFSDRLFGTNQSGKNKNYEIKEIVTLVNSVAGKDYIQYEFSLTNYSNIGSFTTNSSETNPSGVTKLFLNKQSVAKKDLTELFTKLDTLQNIVIELRNPSDANNFATFKITNITSHTSYFEFDVVLYKSFSSGLLTAGATYSAYFDVKENFDDKLSQGNYVGTAETLKTDIETRVVKVPGSSLVPDAEITKLSHLDDTTDLQKPVSTAQQAALDALDASLQADIQSQLVDSTLINGVTESSSVPPTGNIHAIGVGAGTYPNWGGMVIPANNIGTLQRVGGVYSVSLTAIDLTAYATKEIVNPKLYTDKYLGNVFVNELFITGDWGTTDIFLDEYRKESIYGTNVIFKNSVGTILMNISLAPEEINSKIIYRKEGTKEIYAIFNWDIVTSGDIIFGFNAKLKPTSFSISYSPFIKNSFNDLFTATPETTPDVSKKYITSGVGFYTNFNQSANFKIIIDYGESCILIYNTSTGFWEKKTITKSQTKPVGKNLFNPFGVNSGFFEYGSTHSPNAFFYATEPIEVVTGIQYTVSGLTYRAGIVQLLDENKDILSYDDTYTTNDGVDSSKLTFVNYHSDAKYFVLSISNDGFHNSFEDILITNEYDAHTFEAYKPSLFLDSYDSELTENKYLKLSKLFRKNSPIFIGDSITALSNGWNRRFTSELKCNSVNVAVNSANLIDFAPGTVYDGTDFTGNGNTIGNQVKKIIDANYTNPPLILIFAGMNSSVNYVKTDAEIETIFTTAIDSVDRTEVVGIIRWCFMKLSTKYPNAKIIFATQYQAGVGARDYIQQKNTRTNIINACNRLGCSVLDLYFESGIHTYQEVNNANGKYLYDGVHLNADGGVLISELFMSRINQLLKF